MSKRISLFLATDHPAFAGHFPGRPIVPGALLIDLAVRAVEEATGCKVNSVAQAKFLSPALPGEALALILDSTADTARFEIEAPDRKLASGRFVLSAEHS